MDQLTFVEFAYNNAKHSLTGQAPAQLLYWESPQLLDLGTLNPQTEYLTNIDRTDKYLRDMATTLKVATDKYKTAQNMMKQTADKKRKEQTFKVGDMVLIRSDFLPQTTLAHLPRKLRRRYQGPFRVIAVVSDLAYKVDLPPAWHRVHSTFHVSKLKAYSVSDQEEGLMHPMQAPEIYEMEDGSLEYEVEQIVRAEGKGRNKRYLVLWKNYLLHDASWEPMESFTNCPDVLEAFLQKEAKNKPAKCRKQPRPN